jgi:hypothetical protein
MGKLIIKNRYGTIPNDLLNSIHISFKAKGMYAYIQSKPDNWEFSAERISKQVKEGLPSVISALKELENFGYLARNRYQNNKGFWVVDYLLYEIPIEENLIIGKELMHTILMIKWNLTEKKFYTVHLLQKIICITPFVSKTREMQAQLM